MQLNYYPPRGLLGATLVLPMDAPCPVNTSRHSLTGKDQVLIRFGRNPMDGGESMYIEVGPDGFRDFALLVGPDIARQCADKRLTGGNIQTVQTVVCQVVARVNYDALLGVHEMPDAERPTHW
jgi:hypothetical protein